MSADPTFLLARDLTKTFGRFTALRSLSLSVSEGEFLTIVGRNGAGKTTFLKILSSIVTSYTGEVLLGGRNLKHADEATRRKIGFVSHESLLYKDLTVRDNLSFYARMYGVPDRDRKISEMIRKVDLDAKASVLASALSRGMKQRLSLARAFIHEPRVLLLDEPFTGLDERAAEILEDVLAGFKRSRGTVIMVTHDIDRGWTHADRVVVFEKGTVAREISTRETSPQKFKDDYRRILRG